MFSNSDRSTEFSCGERSMNLTASYAFSGVGAGGLFFGGDGWRDLPTHPLVSRSLHGDFAADVPASGCVAVLMARSDFAPINFLKTRRTVFGALSSFDLQWACAVACFSAKACESRRIDSDGPTWIDGFRSGLIILSIALMLPSIIVKRLFLSIWQLRIFFKRSICDSSRSIDFLREKEWKKLITSWFFHSC